MNKFLITIESNSTLQRIIEGELKEKYPKVKPQIYIRKARDVPQITEISISVANLLVSIISLVLQIKASKINDSEIKIKVKNKKTNK